MLVLKNNQLLNELQKQKYFTKRTFEVLKQRFFSELAFEAELFLLNALLKQNFLLNALLKRIFFTELFLKQSFTLNAPLKQNFFNGRTPEEKPQSNTTSQTYFQLAAHKIIRNSTAQRKTLKLHYIITFILFLYVQKKTEGKNSFNMRHHCFEA